MANPQNTYIGMRYVPVYMGEWDESQTYESLVIVTHDNDTLISNRPVPANTPITDTTYWAKMYGGNAQLDNVNTLVEGFQNQLDAMNTKLDELGQGGYVWKPSLAYNMAPGDDITTKLENLSAGENIGFAAGEYLISSAITVNAKCMFAPGAVLKSSEPIIFTQDIVAFDQQIFNIGNPASPTTYTIPNQRIRPEWYGAQGDGTSNDSYAFEAALSAQEGIKSLELGNKTYALASNVDLPATTNIYGTGSTLAFGANGQITFSDENSVQTRIERCIITYPNSTNGAIVVGNNIQHFIVMNCQVGRLTFVLNPPDITTTDRRISLEGCVMNTNGYSILNMINQYADMRGYHITLNNCIFLGNSSVNVLNIPTASTKLIQADVTLSNCLSPSAPLIKSGGNLVLDNNFPCYVTSSFTAKDTTVSIALISGTQTATYGLTASNCDITVNNPGIFIDLALSGNIDNCRFHGTQPFNFTASKAGKDIVISQSLADAGTTVNLTGRSDWTGGVLVTDCNFGSENVQNNPKTFIFNNSPWGEIEQSDTLTPLYSLVISAVSNAASGVRCANNVLYFPKGTYGNTLTLKGYLVNSHTGQRVTNVTIPGNISRDHNVVFDHQISITSNPYISLSLDSDSDNGGLLISCGTYSPSGGKSVAALMQESPAGSHSWAIQELTKFNSSILIGIICYYDN